MLGESQPTSKWDHRIVRFEPGIGAPVLDSSQDVPDNINDAISDSAEPEPSEPTVTSTWDESLPQETAPVATTVWDSVEIGTPVVVAEAEGGAIKYGKLHRVPSPEGKYKGRLYIAVDGDDKKFRLFKEEEVALGVTTKTNA